MSHSRESCGANTRLPSHTPNRTEHKNWSQYCPKTNISISKDMSDHNFIVNMSRIFSMLNFLNACLFWSFSIKGPTTVLSIGVRVSPSSHLNSRAVMSDNLAKKYKARPTLSQLLSRKIHRRPNFMYLKTVD